ncbi:MAG: translation initiation factor IF-2 [Prevotellaceae bacterium]|jgi:translation initiation factor IF-2|nr:translation initiation factor IF-2 [Prevotellaceae bacterium]
MAETIRISKVVKELNIGITTLTDYLKKKGFEVEVSPNSKISGDAYALAKKEFGKEISIKEESKKVVLKLKEMETISIENVKEKQAQEAEEEEILIKTTQVEPPPQIRMKAVDKIDAEAKLKPPQPAEPKPQPVEPKPAEPKPVATEPVALTPETPKPKTVTPQPETVTPQPETVTPQPEDIKPVESVVTSPQEPETTPESRPEMLPAEEPVVTTPTDELIKVKITGKIDLSEINTRTRPEKKTWKERKAKAKARKAEAARLAALSKPPEAPEAPITPITPKPVTPETPTTETPTTESATPPVAKPVVEHIETQVEKLTGPKIINDGQKIDLSVFEPKKKESASERRKKRERIKKGKVDVTRISKTEKVKDSRTKKVTKEKFKPIRQEVDDDAVQRQIKETYARMTEGKGKTKSSKYRRDKREEVSRRQTEEQERLEMQSTVLKLTEFVTASELANMMNVPVVKVIEACMNLGLMVSINQRLDAEALVVVAEEFGFTIEFVSADLQDTVKAEEDRPEDLLPRPPIVTVMGHVDHGKTSLLDYIRKSNVIAGEAGGITQHIGAYNVELQDGQHITFLDTPGHEAFTAMRARGAKVTDMVIIIIAADDAVMPQTVEAINHAVAANVPMIFAINKIDRPGANPEKIKEQLANMNYLVEDWGGKYQCQEIAAKQGLNVDKLLEKVLLEADMLELKANPNKHATGTVIESTLDKGRGYVATILVHGGTLRAGDLLLSGTYYGRVRAMTNERGQKVVAAGPSTPVTVLGLNGAPTAGEIFNVMTDEKETKEIANRREQLLRMQGLKSKKHITLEEIGRRIAIGNFKELNIIVKGDVDGSIEALSDSLIKLSTEEVLVNVIHKAVGAISESDVLLAAASNAIIIGFQVRPSASARKLAENEEIEIRLYSVIYDAINEVKDGIEGMLAPEQKEEVTATVEVREIFKISRVGTVAGCMVKDGKITRHSKIRIIRDGIVVYSGLLGSLKRFKEDVKDVSSGYDCGLNIENFNDIKQGDIIEAYEIVEIKRKL